MLPLTDRGLILRVSMALATLFRSAYLNICHRLLGEEVPFQDLDVKKGILGRLFGR